MNIQRPSFLRASSDEDAIALRPGGAERTPVLMQYLSIARRRKWVIISSIVGALLLGLAVTLLMTPKFTATTTLEIQREKPNFAMAEGVQSTAQYGPEDLEFYQTQYGLLESRSLAQRVASNLRLYNNPQFFKMFGDKKADKWFDGERVIPNASTRETRIGEAADVLLGNFTVSPERQSRLVHISFTSPDPAFSRRVVNAWSEHFIQSTLDRRFQATAYARKFLEDRLNDLRDQINGSERQLVSYAAQQGIINLPATEAGNGQGGQAERSLVADDLAALNRELAIATANRVQAQSRLNTAGSAATETLENQAITGLRQRRAELASDYAKMMAQFEPSYPPAQALQDQITQLDRSIAREEGRVTQTIRGDYQSSVERETNLRARVNGLKSSLLDLRRRSIQYNIYQREVETNRELYNALLQRYKEIGVAGGVGVNNISVVDPAELPEHPSSPKLPLNLLIALLLGTLIGAGAAFALEQMDQGITEPGEVEQVLGVPLLGTVPKAVEGTPIEELSDRKSVLAEAYVSIQTNLSFATDHGIPRSLAVTSSRPSEGKTTTSTALAISIARNGRKVLLVDADMRSPSLHSNFGLDNGRGLSNFLSGSDELDSLIRSSEQTGLSLMPAGPLPPSAPELLASLRFSHLIEVLLQRFDHLVFDGPPVMGLADAPLIASRVEGVVFVVEANSAHQSVVQGAIRRLVSANAPIVGAVLTKFDQKRAHYGYGYDYGYGTATDEPATA